MQEVGGSIPPSSTTNHTDNSLKSPSSRGLGLRPFTAATGVRIPLGTPFFLVCSYSIFENELPKYLILGDSSAELRPGVTEPSDPAIYV